MVEDHVVIIGNGISGITAARHIRKKSAAKITIISGETKHFFSRTALMYIYMGHMRFEDTKPYEDGFWQKNNLNLVHDWVTGVDYDNKTVQLKSGEPLTYNKLIIATGSRPNMIDWPGKDLQGVQGLYSYQDLQLLEKNTEHKIGRAVVVGGGLIGVELAEMLHSRGVSVTFLVRDDGFWGGVLSSDEGKLIGDHLKRNGVDLRLDTELVEILEGESGRVGAVKTNSGEEISCELVGITIGVHPNIDWLRNGKLETNKGILVDDFLRTNIADVYAIGDCAEFRTHPTGRKNIEQVWYTGRMMGETVAQTITGTEKRYLPGNWFNSAKFFDIEYQTYGQAPAALPQGQSEFYWQHPLEEKAIRLVYGSSTGKFLGLNVFGIRLRHHVVDAWLNEGKNIQFIVRHLADANFDPELYKKHEHAIVSAFNSKMGTNLQAEPKQWKRILKWMGA